MKFFKWVGYISILTLYFACMFAGAAQLAGWEVNSDDPLYVIIAGSLYLACCAWYLMEKWSEK